MDKNEMLNNSNGILQTQVQQNNAWIIHMIHEHGEEAEPGVFVLDLTEDGAPNFNEEIALQIEPNESERKITFRILFPNSERYQNLKKQQSQQVQPAPSKLIVEK